MWIILLNLIWFLILHMGYESELLDDCLISTHATLYYIKRRCFLYKKKKKT